MGRENDISHSEPVLSGGQSLMTGLQQFVARRQRRSRSRSQGSRRRRIKEQRARHVQHPRLRGSHRPRLPDSLRVLYGAGEDTERRLFQFLERAQAADDYLQSFRFAHCDPLQKPGHCTLSAVDKMNFLLMSPDQWHDGDKRICKRCFGETKGGFSGLRQQMPGDVL